MTAKGARANNETGQHKKLGREDPGVGSKADTKVKLTLNAVKEDIEHTPYKPTDPSKG